MTPKEEKAPFPYFGGKARIAHSIWEALGNCKHYIEPFFGSGAVLLNRPNYNPQVYTETVNDSDGYIANVWRSLQSNPDEVAKWCDWPVNHADLSARKKRLIEEEAELLKNLIADDNYFNPKMAGYWIWAASCWIGSGLTRIGQRPHVSHGGKGVHKIGQIPHVGHGGKGVHKIGQIPHVTDEGMGVHKIGKRPHLTDGGKGVHKIGQRHHVNNGGQGVQEPYNTNLYTWFRSLSDRLRYVRVVCGDWSRVCGGNWQDKTGIVGIYFDPPYGVTDRDTTLYHHDSTNVAKEVEKWCLERGRKQTYRIVISGYEGEYISLISSGWRVIKWEASGGYANLGNRHGQGNENRTRERLFVSPYCINEEQLKMEGT